MALQVWFLRHGEAVPHDAKPDVDRELTPRGERQGEAAGHGLERSGVELTACYSSPRVRARQTAAIACGNLGLEVEIVEALSSGFDLDDLVELLHAHEDDDRVLLVGHDPDFSMAVHAMTGAQVRMKKGGLAGVDTGELKVLLRPAETAAIAS